MFDIYLSINETRSREQKSTFENIAIAWLLTDFTNIVILLLWHYKLDHQYITNESVFFGYFRLPVTVQWHSYIICEGTGYVLAS